MDPAHPDIFYLWRLWAWASHRLYVLHETYFFLPPPPPPPPKTTWERIASAPGDSIAYVKGLLMQQGTTKAKPKATKAKGPLAPARALNATPGSKAENQRHSPPPLAHLPGYLPTPPLPNLLEQSLHRVDQAWDWGVDTTAATISFTLLPVRMTRLGVQYTVRSVLALGQRAPGVRAQAGAGKAPTRFRVLNPVAAC